MTLKTLMDKLSLLKDWQLEMNLREFDEAYLGYTLEAKLDDAVSEAKETSEQIISN